MPTKSKAIKKKMEEASGRLEFRPEEEVEAREKEMERYKGAGGQPDQIVARMLGEIKKHSSQPEQRSLSFMPTAMTRTTPFFPLSRRNMKDQPLENLEWKTSWGRLAISGKRLTIHDETVLLALLMLAKKQGSEVVEDNLMLETTPSEVCRIAGIQRGKDTIAAILTSIKRMAATQITLEVKEKGKLRYEMGNSILSRWRADHKTKKLTVVIDSDFWQLYKDGFVTNIDLEFRASLRGDIAKALYRFYQSQPRTFTWPLRTLARAINIDLDLPTFKIRDRIRRANRELKAKGYLSKSIVSKDDKVTIWKSGKYLRSEGV